MAIANTVSDFLNHVLFANDFEGDTYEAVKKEIEGYANAMMDAFEAAGINIKTKYYYRVIMEDMPSSYAEYYIYFGLMPGTLGTQTSEGFNKIVKNFFTK